MKMTAEERNELQEKRNALQVEYDILRYGLAKVLETEYHGPTHAVFSAMFEHMKAIGLEIEELRELIWPNGRRRRRVRVTRRKIGIQKKAVTKKVKK